MEIYSLKSEKNRESRDILLQKIQQLKEQLSDLERENRILKAKPFYQIEGDTVKVPGALKPLFDRAQELVKSYFKGFKTDPSRGTVEISGERYLLIRASALSFDFLKTFQDLYADRGNEEAFRIGRNFLFDIAHVIGMQDAKSFIQKMNVTDPIQKLSAGPVHFAFSGWAFVNISAESHPSPDENFYLKYTHPYSFEAASWIESMQKSDTPVCIMNCGYSSGWCEESFGIPLTAVEVSCRARGDEECSFIMAPPNKINKYLKKEGTVSKGLRVYKKYEIPSFFQRKKVEEELKNAKQRAEESEKIKTEFLANMSHEIRTPLNAIMGYVDLILKDKLSVEHREYLEIVKESGKILQTIISDILDISKIEAGQLLIESVPFSLNETAKNIAAACNALLVQKTDRVKLTTKFKPTSEIDYIKGDPTRLRQILFNLLSNAIKFTEEGTIEFGYKKTKKGELTFYVKDTGIGISQDKHEKIFNLFDQADASTTRKYGGSGLGLTITKKLVEHMGGKIWLESSPGKGSAFYFSVPFQPAKKAKAIQNVEVNPEAQKSHKFHILVVEDNMVNLKLTERLLEKAGYEVSITENGKAAIEEFLRNKDIDLILMDMQMPIMDGLEATKRIRSLEAKQKKTPIPIIALTASAMKKDKEKCMKAGCDYYLTKPIIYDQLAHALEKFL
ncbi:MAG: response regulator [Deltaproteobacteria bacterium]|nr:response regulator [Deltaproteobacteria bacterium]